MLIPLGANNRIQGTEIDANPGAGLTDSAISPSAWAGTSNAPMPRPVTRSSCRPAGYSDGANDNTGLGMWGHELAVGTTAYLNETRQFHAATLATFDFQSKKEDSETKVGNVMNLEGGLGADFLKGGLVVGLDYYASFKLTDDQIDRLPNILVRGKNKAFGRRA